MRTAYFKTAALTALVLVALTLDTALAAETQTGVLPYESWLRTLQQSLTGPVAFSVAMIGIVTCGATLILSGGEISRFMQSIIFLVLVMTLLIGANALMSRFFNGASIGTVPIAETPAVSADPLSEGYALMSEEELSPAPAPAGGNTPSEENMDEEYLQLLGRSVSDVHSLEDFSRRVLRNMSLESRELNALLRPVTERVA